VINGQCAGDWSGCSVSSAGDVNGDGLADLIVGAYRSDPAAGSYAGRSYVVFGQTGQRRRPLGDRRRQWRFRDQRPVRGDFSGWSVSAAGDVNGDGLADLIVGAYRSDPAAGSWAGRSYVVFGKTGSGAVDLSAVAAGQWRLRDQRPVRRMTLVARSVSSAGDVNGDGLADLIVGASRGAIRQRAATPGAATSSSARPVAAAVDLSAIAAGIGGFVINGQCAGDFSGGASRPPATSMATVSPT
jgi:hypothetical protein